MSNENITKNWVFWLLIAVTVFNFSAFFFGKLAINKISDEVIQKLKKEYSPSPYGPGIDPDKVDPDAFRGNQTIMLTPRDQDQKMYSEIDWNRYSAFERPPGRGTELQRSQDWHDNWERERGYRD